MWSWEKIHAPANSNHEIDDNGVTGTADEAGWIRTYEQQRFLDWHRFFLVGWVRSGCLALFAAMYCTIADCIPIV